MSDVKPPEPRCTSSASQETSHLLSSAELFAATLSRCHEELERHIERDPKGEPLQDLTLEQSFCWLAVMATRLGLSEQDTSALAAPYPRFASLIERQRQDQSYATIASRAALQDDFENAIDAYKQHLRIAPYDQETRLVLGRLLLDRSERDEVWALYEEGRDLNSAPCLIALKAELLMSEGRFDQAYLVAAEAYELAPLHPEVLVTFAQTTRWMLNYDDERDLLERALQSHQQHPLALARLYESEDPSCEPQHRLIEARAAFIRRPTRHIHHSFIYAAMGAQRYDLALSEARRLMRRDAESVSAQLALAYTLLAMGQLYESYERLKLTLEREPHHPFALLLMALVSSLLEGATPDGELALERLALAAHRSLRLALFYSQALRAHGQEEEAHRICADLYTRFPNRSPIINAYTDSLIERGEFHEAKRVCLTRLSHFPSDLEVRLALAKISLRQGALDEAERHLERLQTHPEAQSMRVQITFERQAYEETYHLSLALLKERPVSSELIERAVNACFKLDPIDEHFLTLASQRGSEALFPNQLALFAHLYLTFDEPAEAQRALSELNDRSLRVLTLERLELAAEAARQLHEPEALVRYASEGLRRVPTHPTFTFFEALGWWWLGHHERAVEQLSLSAQCLQDALQEEQLATLLVWLCELNRHAEARAPLAWLQAQPEYVRGVHASGGLDLLEARVLLASTKDSERERATRTLSAWLSQLTLLSGRDERASAQLLNAYERACAWLLETHHASHVITLIEPLIPTHEGGSGLWLSLAHAYRAEGHLEAAAFALERLSEAEGADEHALLERAELLELLEQRAAALNAYEEAFERFGDNLEVRLERALALIRASRLDVAEQELMALLEVARQEDETDPHSAPMQRGLASLVEASFDLPKASPQPQPETLTTHLPTDSSLEPSQGESPQLGPVTEHVLFLWLSQLFQHASLDEAERLTHGLTHRLGASRYLSGFLGLAKLWSGLTAEALPGLREGASRDLYFAFEYVRALWESGAREHAAAVLQECVSVAPQEVEYLTQLISYLLDLSDPHSAHAYLLALESVDPHEAEALRERVFEALNAH